MSNWRNDLLNSLQERDKREKVNIHLINECTSHASITCRHKYTRNSFHEYTHILHTLFTYWPTCTNRSLGFVQEHIYSTWVYDDVHQHISLTNPFSFPNRHKTSQPCCSPPNRQRCSDESCHATDNLSNNLPISTHHHHHNHPINHNPIRPIPPPRTRTHNNPTIPQRHRLTIKIHHFRTTTPNLHISRRYDSIIKT